METLLRCSAYNPWPSAEAILYNIVLPPPVLALNKERSLMRVVSQTIHNKQTRLNIGVRLITLVVCALIIETCFVHIADVCIQ